jgi:hypothetical protein
MVIGGYHFGSNQIYGFEARKPKQEGNGERKLGSVVQLGKLQDEGRDVVGRRSASEYGRNCLANI